MQLELSFWGSAAFMMLPALVAFIAYVAWYHRHYRLLGVIAFLGIVLLSGMIDVCPETVPMGYLIAGPVVVWIALIDGWPRPSHEVPTRRQYRRVLARSQRLCLGKPLRKVPK